MGKGGGDLSNLTLTKLFPIQQVYTDHKVLPPHAANKRNLPLLPLQQSKKNLKRRHLCKKKFSFFKLTHIRRYFEYCTLHARHMAHI